MKGEYDKYLFKKMDIFLHCHGTHTDLTSELTIRDDLSYLESEEFEKSYYDGSLAYPLDLEDILREDLTCECGKLHTSSITRLYVW